MKNFLIKTLIIAAAVVLASYVLPGVAVDRFTTALLVALVGSVEGIHPPVLLTLKEHVDVPQELTAVQVTTVVPFGNVLPDAGEHVTVGEGVPVADGVA